MPCSGNEGGTERLTAWAQIGLLRAVCCPHSELSCFPGPDLGAVNKVRSHTAVSPDIKPTSCRSPKCPRGQVDTAPGLGFALVGWVRMGAPRAWQVLDVVLRALQCLQNKKQKKKKPKNRSKPQNKRFYGGASKSTAITLEQGPLFIPCSQPANTQAMPLQEGAGWALAALAEYIGAKGQLALGRKHPKELASVLGLSSAAPFPPASWTRRSKLCQRENS